MEAPRQPIKKTRKSQPLPSQTKCPIHETSTLKYVPCECRIIIEEKETSWLIKHTGTHNHLLPPMFWQGLDQKSIRQIQNMVLSAPEATPKQLQCGQSSRYSVIKIDESFHDINKVQQERNKVLFKRSLMSSNLNDIINSRDLVNPTFIKKF